MLVWMAYVIEVTLLLSVAALCAERAARVRRRSSRWIWLTAIVASLAVPVLVSSVSIEVPNLHLSSAVEKVVPLKSVTSPMLSPVTWMAGRTGSLNVWGGLDAPLTRSWLVASLLLSVAIAASAGHLFWRKRAWKTASLNGANVYVAPDTGPAVVGLLQPRIVVPEWIMRAPASQQAMVMAHERSHIEAGDQKLLTTALCLLVLMPWNLPLWWQLRRLRRAIEVDCDARVLKHGHSATAYGEALIDVGQRRSAFVGAVAAMSESVSFLEQRIKIMTSAPTRWRRISAVTLVVLSLGIVTVAAQVAPPNAPGDVVDHEITLSDAVLDRYVGFYQFGPSVLMAVTRNGHQLTTQLTGQPTVDIYPKGETAFFVKVVKASIDFVSAGQGPATALVLHQNGRDINAPRIDAGTAQQINANLDARMRAQTPAPGSEAALRKLVEGLMTGMPDYAAMASDFADVTRQQLTSLHASIGNMGSVQRVEFRGVGSAGWDIFEVRHEKDAAQWRIALDADGKVAGALVQAGP